MTTVATLIAQCRNDYLLTGGRDQRNKLAGAIVDASVETVTFAYDLGGIAAGARLAVDLEDLYVWTAVPGDKTATVQRGEGGTTAATHADGAVVSVNPPWSDAQIVRAFNDELRSLSSPSNGLYQMVEIDVTYSPTVEGYDLVDADDHDIMSIWQVRYDAIGVSADWPLIPKTEWEYLPSLDTGEFASGQAIMIRGYADPGRTVRVFARAAFNSTLDAYADVVETTTGLPATAVDLLPLGAAIRLTAGREIRRNLNETQGDTRRAAEVPPGAQLQSMRGLLEVRRSRIREEASRLARQHRDRW